MSAKNIKNLFTICCDISLAGEPFVNGWLLWTQSEYYSGKPKLFILLPVE
jgi:hypothetical protein